MSMIEELKEWLIQQKNKHVESIKNNPHNFNGMLMDTAREGAYLNVLIKIEELEAGEKQDAA